MGQNLDYLSTNQPTDEYTHKLQHRVLEMRDDKEWRENYMTWEMKLDERYETGHKAGREEELCRLIKKKDVYKRQACGPCCAASATRSC